MIAAGNLAGQVLEQLLFILAFYGGVPKGRYLRPNNTLKTANDILLALRKKNPNTGKTFLEHARKHSPRIRKFARWPRSLDKWRRSFNEPSHFRNPAARAETTEADIGEFVRRLRSILDARDPHLTTAAVNELRSQSDIRAVIGNDPECTPGILFDVIVTPKNLVRRDGKLSLLTDPYRMYVVSETKNLPRRWPSVPVLVQHSVGIAIETRFVTKDGQPVDVTSSESIFKSLGKTEDERKQVERRLRKLGYGIRWT